MTSEQAYQQADTENLYATDQTNTDIIFRAMEIFVGAFAEWSGNNCMLHRNMWYKRELPTDESEIPKYTTLELIAIFEKIDNK